MVPPSATYAAPFPFSTKPRSSSETTPVMVVSSWTSTKSMSPGETPAILYARSAASLTASKVRMSVLPAR